MNPRMDENESEDRPPTDERGGDPLSKRMEEMSRQYILSGEKEWETLSDRAAHPIENPAPRLDLNSFGARHTPQSIPFHGQ